MEVKSMGQGRPITYEMPSNTGIVVDTPEEKAPEELNNKVTDKKEQYSEKEIKNALEKLNTFLEDKHTYAEYAVHEKLGTVMIKIIEDDTKQVILEVPPKKILDMVAKMCEMVGMIFDKKA